jgi:hypothetical protein
VAELSRLVIAKAVRETRFRARAVRIDSTVVEADVRYPTDEGLAADAVRTLARERKRLSATLGGSVMRVRDRSRAVGERRRAIGRTLRRRTGEAKSEVIVQTGQTGRLLAASTREARRVAAEARARAQGLRAPTETHLAQRGGRLPEQPAKLRDRDPFTLVRAQLLLDPLGERQRLGTATGHEPSQPVL